MDRYYAAAGLTAMAVVLALMAGQPAGAVSLRDGGALTIDGTTFTIENCLSCGASDVMVQDGGKLGVKIDNSTGAALLSAAPGSTNADLSFTLDVTSALNIDGGALDIAGSAVGNLPQVTAGVKVENTMPQQIGSLGATLNSPTAATSFTGLKTLTLSNSLAVLSKQAKGNKKNLMQLTSVAEDLTAVPEPGTIGLLAAGLAGLLAMRRRRR